ncbi:hypothetical protein OH76DRAFT_321408 [Lentinus brumalis]|uniref:Uncharacterized protein n=1 Tax=Lentinus brumalis TaxID=2498619 RepID=A0A371DFI5_9APHY|nr:hypothetical protein OH76DRAFT_321408 [Polyporus brumalis]
MSSSVAVSLCRIGAHVSKTCGLLIICTCKGAIYFGVLLLLNVLHVVLSVLATTGTVSGELENFSAFTAPLTTILASRFLLELQEANKMVIKGVDPDDPLHTSRGPYDTNRPSFISSLGPFNNPDLSAPCDDESEWRLGSRSGREEEGGAQTATSSSAAA